MMLNKFVNPVLINAGGEQEKIMYKVRMLIVKEVVEVTVEAKYCFVDGNNNLVFQNQAFSFPEPIAMISASRWISVKKEIAL